jgi:anthranilate phosphoribosyltransferase
MIHEAISKVVVREDLTESEMTDVMTEISEGRATPAQIGAILMGLRMKGETVDEITGAVRVLRSKCTKVPVSQKSGGIIDTAGTGGDGTGSFNVSTTAAFVAAGYGLKVAKHGNRCVSSHCGSADVLEALGLNLDLTPDNVAQAVDQIGIGFLFAPLLHPAMRHAVLPRREVGLKSIFNLIGPLTNPAGADIQLIGVFRAELTETLAHVLNRLGCRSAFVVYGEDGYDEISITGPTRLARLHEGRVTSDVLQPEDLGLKRARPEDILGGDAARNANITLDVLRGEPGPCRDMVLMNAAAVLVAAGEAGDLGEGVRKAGEAIDSGRALNKLEELIAYAQETATPKAAAGGANEQ